MEYIVTGKKDTHYAEKREGSRSRVFSAALQKYAGVQAVFNSKDELVRAVMVPAFIVSGLRDGQPDQKTINHTYNHLVKCGTIIER